jgi:hypothetical protein
MNRVKLSEVFELAANEYLFEGSYEDDDTWDKSVHSCDAIWRALGELPNARSRIKEPCIEYIEEFAPNLQHGLCGTFRAFSDVKDNVVQEYRYSWLMFLAMIAEEEGSVLEYEFYPGQGEAKIVYIKE